VEGSVLSQVNWYSTSGCRFTARWIIDVAGTGDVTIKGAAFPGIVERVVYNVLGTRRTIIGETGIAGHILSPQNNFELNVGVTYGKVIVGNVTYSNQNNKPNCIKFKDVTVRVKVLKPALQSDTTIYVVGLESLIVGDRICINSNCRIVVSGEFVDLEGDGNYVGAVTIDQAFNVQVESGDFLSAIVTDPATANRDTPLAVPPSPSPVDPTPSP